LILQIRNHHLVSLIVSVISLLVLHQEAMAADTKDQFAVRGVGLIPCQVFEKEREAKSEVYRLTMAWADGYITGLNQQMPDTYDVLAYEGTELVAVVLGEHCKTHPADRVFPVLRSLLQKLHQERVTSYSDKVEVVVGERKGSLYKVVVQRLQQSLQGAGQYKGKITSQFDQATIDAVKAYQRSIKFEPTGFPDQLTLWRLFRSQK